MMRGSFVLNRRQMRKVLFLHILLFLFAGVFNSILHSQSLLIAVMELLAWIEFLFCIGTKSLTREINNRGSRLEVSIVILLLCISIISFVINAYSLKLYLNGFRSAFRYFAFFFACLALLQREDIKHFFELAYKLLIVNTIVCTIEYFVLGYKGDYCSGLFGVERVNSYINAFIVVMAAYGLSGYIHKQVNLKKLIIIELCCMYISVLSELKFFFFEFILIVVLSLIFYRPTKRTFSIVGIGALVLILLPMLVNRYWTSNSSDYLSLQGLITYMNQSTIGYSSINDIGRINGIPQVNRYFFSGKSSLLGMGLGYCDYGSSFIGQYEYLHYTWFTYLLTYMELGWFGIVAYFGLLVTPAIKSFKLKTKTADGFDKMIYGICFCVGFISTILLFYNSTIRNIPAYFIFFILSFYAAINNNLERS